MLHAQRLHTTNQVSLRALHDNETRFSQVLDATLMVAGVGSMSAIAIWAWVIQLSSFGPI
jgi:hypothetical protein